jgi:hypothetical protein
MGRSRPANNHEPLTNRIGFAGSGRQAVVAGRGPHSIWMSQPAGSAAAVAFAAALTVAGYKIL